MSPHAFSERFAQLSLQIRRRPQPCPNPCSEISLGAPEASFWSVLPPGISAAQAKSLWAKHAFDACRAAGLPDSLRRALGASAWPDSQGVLRLVLAYDESRLPQSAELAPEALREVLHCALCSGFASLCGKQRSLLPAGGLGVPPGEALLALAEQDELACPAAAPQPSKKPCL